MERTKEEKEARALTYCNALRALIAFIEANPTLPVPSYAHGIDQYDCTAEEIRTAALVHGLDRKKVYIDNYMYIEISIPYQDAENNTQILRADYNTNRENVCRKIVKSTHIEPERYIPGYLQEARTVEDVEWECSDPILAPTKQPVPEA